MYSYLIFGGNNSGLIRAALARRPWWKPAIEDEPPKTALDAAVQNEKLLTAFKACAFDFCWKPTSAVGSLGEGGNVHSVASGASGGRSPHAQLVNHFPAVASIGSKNGLYRALCDYRAYFGLGVGDLVPRTFLLSDIQGSGRSDFAAFCAHFKSGQPAEGMPAKHYQKGYWLVKPAYLNQGRGIEVFNSLSSIKEHLLSVDTGAPSVAGGQEWVVQKYIEAPALLNDRKFDVRVWVLVLDDPFSIHFYRDGYIRTSSERFSLDSSSSATAKAGVDGHMVHLTNYCMQKLSTNLGAFEEGNTLSFEQLQVIFDEMYAGTGVSPRLREQLLPRWKEAILDAVLACRDRLFESSTSSKGGTTPRRRCFELFGFDIFIDCDFRSWLIEVNTNPYLGVQNPWHQRLLLRMTEEMLQLAVDPVFPGARTAAAAASAGVTPLPADTYDNAFLYEVPWIHGKKEAGAGGGDKAGTAGDEGSSSGGGEAAPSFAPPPPYRDVRATTGWELLYTEDTAVPVLSIPHQAAMAPQAVNAAVVEAAAAAAKGGRALAWPDVAALLGRSGGAAGEGDGAPALAALPAPSSLGPFTRRYLRRRDEDWLYPLGPSPPPPSRRFAVEDRNDPVALATRLKALQSTASSYNLAAAAAAAAAATPRKGRAKAAVPAAAEEGGEDGEPAGATPLRPLRRVPSLPPMTPIATNAATSTTAPTPNRGYVQSAPSSVERGRARAAGATSPRRSSLTNKAGGASVLPGLSETSSTAQEGLPAPGRLPGLANTPRKADPPASQAPSSLPSAAKAGRLPTLSPIRKTTGGAPSSAPATPSRAASGSTAATPADGAGRSRRGSGFSSARPASSNAAVTDGFDSEAEGYRSAGGYATSDKEGGGSRQQARHDRGRRLPGRRSASATAGERTSGGGGSSAAGGGGGASNHRTGNLGALREGLHEDAEDEMEGKEGGGGGGASGRDRGGAPTLEPELLRPSVKPTELIRWILHHLAAVAALRGVAVAYSGTPSPEAAAVLAAAAGALGAPTPPLAQPPVPGLAERPLRFLSRLAARCIAWLWDTLQADIEASVRALSAGALPLLFAYAAAFADAELQAFAAAEAAEAQGQSGVVVSPAATPASRLSRLLPKPSRALLSGTVLPFLLSVYRRDASLRQTTPLPPLSTLEELLLPTPLLAAVQRRATARLGALAVPTLSAPPAELDGGASSALAPPGTGAAAAGPSRAQLLGHWEAAAGGVLTELPLVEEAHKLGLRLLGCCLAFTRGPAEAEAAAAGASATVLQPSLATAAVASPFPLSRESLFASLEDAEAPALVGRCAVLAAVGCITSLSGYNQDCLRRLARDALAFVSSNELQTVRRRLRTAAAAAAASNHPSAPVYRVAVAGVEREAQVRALALKKAAAGGQQQAPLAATTTTAPPPEAPQQPARPGRRDSTGPPPPLPSPAPAPAPAPAATPAPDVAAGQKDPALVAAAVEEWKRRKEQEAREARERARQEAMWKAAAEEEARRDRQLAWEAARERLREAKAAQMLREAEQARLAAAYRKWLWGKNGGSGEAAPVAPEPVRRSSITGSVSGYAHAAPGSHGPSGPPQLLGSSASVASLGLVESNGGGGGSGRHSPRPRHRPTNSHAAAHAQEPHPGHYHADSTAYYASGGEAGPIASARARREPAAPAPAAPPKASPYFSAPALPRRGRKLQPMGAAQGGSTAGGEAGSLSAGVAGAVPIPLGAHQPLPSPTTPRPLLLPSDTTIAASMGAVTHSPTHTTFNLLPIAAAAAVVAAQAGGTASPATPASPEGGGSGSGYYQLQPRQVAAYTPPPGLQQRGGHVGSAGRSPRLVDVSPLRVV